MKIDLEKTNKLKNLLKVGTEHTMGYQGSTHILADSIMQTYVSAKVEVLLESNDLTAREQTSVTSSVM